MIVMREDEIEKDIKRRSDEFQEILGIVPPWILRRGIAIISIFLLVILMGSAIFSYPETISTSMILTGTTPPASLVAKESGRLQELNVSDKQLVNAGKYMAVIENAAETNDILILKRYIQEYNQALDGALPIPPKDLNLGSMQSLYSSFYIKLFDYKEFIDLQYYAKKIDFLHVQMNQYENYYNNLKRQQNIVKEQFVLNTNQYQRDSLLNNKGIISNEELELSKKRYLEGALSFENILSTIQNTEIQITQMRENLLDIECQYLDKKNTLQIQLETYIAQLVAEIQVWEQNYVFLAPIDGQVIFTNYWVNNQNVSAGESVFNIIPTDSGLLVGKAIMPMLRSGKVEVGQKVNISFTNFPDTEFGIVVGKVKNISKVPIKSIEGENNYIVEIELSNGLKTTYNRELPYQPEMHARADIVTNDLTLLERLFLPIKKILTERI